MKGKFQNGVCRIERLLLNHAKTPGFLAPGGEEFNPGPETRLDHSEFLCNKVLLSIKKIEKTSDIDIRRGQKEYPLASVSNGVQFSSVQSLSHVQLFVIP